MVLGARVQTVGNGIAVDLDNEVVRDTAGSPIELRNQAFAVLRYLIERPGQLVTKDELMEAVWPHVAVTDDSLVQCIHEIRRALGDTDRSILKTVARRGYRLAEPSLAIAQERPVRRPRADVAMIAVTLLVAVVAVLAAWWLARPPAPTHAIPAIAVLPFDNLSKDPDQRYFADGMTEDLITDLSKISGVMVIARNSVWPYRDQAVDMHQVADKLGVRYLLEGSVRREDDQVRINAQLIDASDGHHLWANRYDGSFGDVFTLQDTVIANIVSALAVELTTEEVAATAEVETTVPEAYDTLLLGMEFLHRDTEEGSKEAIRLFGKAASLDPGYSRAYAAIAAAQQRLVLSNWYTMTGSGQDIAYNGMITNLAKAMVRPTSLSYMVAAVWESQIGQFDSMLDHIEKAVALAPNDPEVHASKARILIAIGRAEEAEREVRLAMRLDPGFAPAILHVLSMTLFAQGKYEEVIDAIERIKVQQAVTTDDYVTLVASLGQLGRKEGVKEGIDTFNRMAKANDFDPMTVQEAQWWWAGDTFDFYWPYVERVVEGLRKAGVPEGAGTDIPIAQYKGIVRRVGAEFDVIGATEIKAPEARMMRQAGVPFIDVRAHDDYAKGHVPGAYNLSLVVDLSRETLARIVAPDDTVVFYCHTKYCGYSAYASAKAVIWGYKHVYRFAGGFPEWEFAGYPVERSPTVEGQAE